jgi:hypothetical protein
MTPGAAGNPAVFLNPKGDRFGQGMGTVLDKDYQPARQVNAVG